MQMTDRQGGQLMSEHLEAIDKRAAAATPGPWFGFYDDDGYGTEILIAKAAEVSQDALDHAICPVCAVSGANEDVGLVLGWGSKINKANAEFIAHARQDIPAMSARIKELEAKLAKVRTVDELIDAIRLTVEYADAASLRSKLAKAMTLLETAADDFVSVWNADYSELASDFWEQYEQLKQEVGQ